MITTDTSTVNEQFIQHVKDESTRFYSLKSEIAKVIVGQQHIVDFILIGLLCEGHILLEGLPGVAKTTMVKAVTQALGLSFNRIQFTPDLLPADLIGTLIYNPQTQQFETKKGPIFANLILGDEINRTPAKVQAALLECMQEHQVTIGSNTYKLERPFLVFATQNPIEQEGTYRLPEAQVDRFLFKLLVHYPSMEQEKQIITATKQPASIAQLLSKDDIFAAQKLVQQVYVDEKIIDYILAIIFSTRSPQTLQKQDLSSYIQHGVSPRATLGMYQACQAHAFIKKRHFVTPDDVKAVAPAVLRHRIALTYEAEADAIQTDEIIRTIINSVPCP